MPEHECPYEFQARVPLPCLMHLVSMYKEGTLMTSKGEALQHCGAILGESGALVSTFEANPLIGSTQPDQSLNMLMAELEEYTSYNQENPELATAGAIPWSLIIQIVLKILESLNE